MLKSGKTKIQFDGGNVNRSSSEDRQSFKRLYFEDIKSYYSFKFWLRDNLMMYNSGAGDYDEPLYEHMIIFLTHLKEKFKKNVDRPHWHKRISSILRYAIKLGAIKDE
jgi:hypothetical protein